MLKIMDVCGFRVGNRKYEKLYGSYGLTTLQQKHVEIHPGTISISFIGKKKVLNECQIQDPTIVKYIHQFYASCAHPHEYLFQYRNTQITMNDINTYLKEFGFTCKDLRTWNANLTLLHILKQSLMEHNVQKITDKERKRILKECIIETAAMMHHTSTISKTSYLYKPLLERFLHTKKCCREIIKTESMEKYMHNILSTSDISS